MTCLVAAYFIYNGIIVDKADFSNVKNMSSEEQVKFWNETPHNLYELLGIEARNFDVKALKSGYKAAALKFHPDKNLDSDTTELFLEVKMANDILKDPDLKYAYDVFGQTNFAQEETIYKGLQHSKKMSEEERNKTFWHIINNKRMFNALIEIVPYYFAWMLAAILLVNRSYGRPTCILLILACGGFEGFTKVYFGVTAF